jgi:outer membrane protein OmpA-like peptidoglycan-associated protein
LEHVYFDIDKHDLLPESIESLKKLLDVLKKYPEMKIEIGGHTSSVGGYDHNVS